MSLKIFNTLTKQKENFKPLKKNKVGFYQCGPTVYWTQHIGNMRSVVMADIIDRTLKYLNYDVDFVRNYTDVGHLTSDGDEGEDKLEKAAKKEGLSPKEIAQKYISIYESDIKKLNTLPPTHKPKATEHIQEIIDMVQVLLDKDFAYSTDLAIYFDISKAKDYTRLSGQKIEEQIKGAGTGEISDSQKRNSNDFSLWFFKAGKHKNALQFWQSPFSSPLVKNGEGFPGWHIECSAMSKKYLGNIIDIHMGGIEHISIHHTNEIAQSESANGKKFVNYWVHNEHLMVNNGKMSKSEGTSYSLSEIEKKGFDPIALRYFFLQAHYRSKQNFTWEALKSSQKGLANLYEQVVELQNSSPLQAKQTQDLKSKVINPVSNLFRQTLFLINKSFKKKGEVNQEFKKEFTEKIEDDFNTPQALAVVFELLKFNLSKDIKLATILDFDKILGLELDKAKEKIPQEIPISELPQNIQDLIKERQKARDNKDYKKSDELREKILKSNCLIKDTQQGQKVYINNS